MGVLAAVVLTVAVSACVSIVPTRAPSPQIPADQQRLFDEGMRAYRNQEFTAATRDFQSVIGRYPGSPLLEEAQWMLGKSHEAGGAFETALREYEAFLRNYPDSSRRYEASLRSDFLRGILDQTAVKRPIIRRVGFFSAALPEANNGVIGGLTARMPTAGRGTLIVPGYGTNGVYFPTDLAPVLDEALGRLVAEAHERGIEVWARIPARNLPWLKATGEERDIRYDPLRRRMVSTSLLDLFNPLASQRLIRLYLDLAATGVDGIVIDDDSFSAPAEGFGPSAREKFREDFGIRLEAADLFPVMTPPPGEGAPSEISSSPLFWQWVGWKNRETLSRLSAVLKAVRDRHPSVQWARIVPIAAVTEPHRVLARSGIDLLEEKRHGFDYFGVALSFRDDPARFLGILRQFQDLIGEASRVFALVPMDEEPTIRTRLESIKDFGLILVDGKRDPAAPLTKLPR